MQYLERLFKKRPILFITITFIFAGCIASIFQEVGNAMTQLLRQILIFNSWWSVILVYLGIVLLIILSAYIVDRIWIKRVQNAKITWETINDKYARLQITNNDDYSLEECKGELSEIYSNEDNSKIELDYKYFSWSNEAYRDGSQQTTSIPAGHDSILDIAKNEEGKLFFTFAYHRKEFPKKGSYTLSIKISGEKNGVEFTPKIKDFVLEFDGRTLEIKSK